MKKILVVDDQPELRQLVTLSLGRGDYEIIHAEDGQSALERARAEAPDLVILDLMMPGLPDGFGVCWEIKADPRFEHTKVLILTAMSGHESQRGSEEVGADGFFPKPFSPAKLATRVAELLSEQDETTQSDRKRVLVVDDRPEIRRLVSLTLGHTQYEVEEACDGETALDAVRRMRPHLVVLDLMMPGSMNGYDVCWAVKSDLDLSDTRVLLLTARGQEEDKAAGNMVGADAYVVKPFSPLDLISRVDRLLASA